MSRSLTGVFFDKAAARYFYRLPSGGGRVGPFDTYGAAADAYQQAQVRACVGNARRRGNPRSIR